AWLHLHALVYLCIMILNSDFISNNSKFLLFFLGRRYVAPSLETRKIKMISSGTKTLLVYHIIIEVIVQFCFVIFRCCFVIIHHKTSIIIDLLITRIWRMHGPFQWQDFEHVAIFVIFTGAWILLFGLYKTENGFS
ncbi:hypothetical protein ACJX0J_020771, partial [Zea mays]